MKTLVLELAPLMAIMHSKPLLQVLLLPEESVEWMQANAGYDAVALGGTFDYLHLGHQILLLQAMLAAKKEILVGVSGGQLLDKKKNKECLQTLNTRMQSVRNYVKMVRPDL